MRTLVDLQQPNRMLCCTAITVYSFRILIEKLWYSSDCCEFTLSKSFFTCILKVDGFESFSGCVSLPTLHRNDKNQLNTTILNWIINTEAHKFTFLDLIVIMLMLWICNIKNHSSRGYSKWMDLTAFQNNCSFEYCTVVAKISWMQEVWIGNQLINREARNFTCLPVISYPGDSYPNSDDSYPSNWLFRTRFVCGGNSFSSTQTAFNYLGEKNRISRVTHFGDNYVKIPDSRI